MVRDHARLVDDSGASTVEADAAYRARGIIVRGMKGYGLPGMLRISIGTAEEMEAVAEATAAFMQRTDRAKAHG